MSSRPCVHESVWQYGGAISTRSDDTVLTTSALLYRLVLQRVTLSECSALSTDSSSYGGAVALMGANAMLNQTKLMACSATVGGGMWASGSLFDVVECAFESNTADMGTALTYERRPFQVAEFSTVARSAFRANGGGAMMVALAPISWTCLPGQWMPQVGRVEEDVGEFMGGCPFLCSPGFYGGELTSHVQPDCLDACPLGHFCPEGSIWPMPCPAGTKMDFEGAASIESCLPCELPYDGMRTP